MIALAGLAVILIGFLLRVQPLLVIVLAALVTGLGAHLSPIDVLALLGKGFNTNRYVTVIYVVLPLIGLLERHGLQDRARALIADMRGATFGRLLAAYMLFRQITAGLGLTSIAGHPQTVRPLLAPMAEAAAARDGELSEERRDQVRALAAGTDNIALFFGEDIFLAISSILLMKAFLEQYGIVLAPLQLSLWAIPAAVAAFVVHGIRLQLIERRWRKEAKR